VGRGVPRLDVVQGEDDEVELPEEGDGQLLDVHVVRGDVQLRVQLQHAFPRHQRFRLPLVLLLEQELAVQVRQLRGGGST
jgi:hypothetical protein